MTLKTRQPINNLLMLKRGVDNKEIKISKINNKMIKIIEEMLFSMMLKIVILLGMMKKKKLNLMKFLKIGGDNKTIIKISKDKIKIEITTSIVVIITVHTNLIKIINNIKTQIFLDKHRI